MGKANQTALTLEDLFHRAKEAFEQSGVTQSDIAKRIESQQPLIARAFKRASIDSEGIYLKILLELTGEEFEPVTMYRRQ